MRVFYFQASLNHVKPTGHLPEKSQSSILMQQSMYPFMPSVRRESYGHNTYTQTCVLHDYS